jgi:hypothetical protein
MYNFREWENTEMDSLTSHKIDINSELFIKKIKTWMKNNYDRSENEIDYEQDINTLLQGYQTDLGGLVAIRGFIYQYYVAIYYMLQMVHKKDVWWHSVVFELMDDIALLGENHVRFIQVKTVKEAGEANYFTLGDLCKRENGEFESWLDKLFLNFHRFDIVHKKAFFTSDINDIVVEFEIATNNTYNKDLNSYSNNVSFCITNKEKLNKLSERLAVPSKKTGFKLQDETGKEIEWCLSRFRLHHMDRFAVLKNQIISIIKEISKMDSTDVSEHILKYIFYSVVERTQSDQVPDIKQYVFTKEEVQDMIMRIKPTAMRDAKDYLHSQDIQSKFVQCFEELRIDFMRIASPVRIDLLQTLTWIQDEFSKKSSKDIFVYVRFLHLLFDMTNSDSERSIKSSGELTALKKSLEIMTLCLTFYVDKQFLLSDSSLITKQGKNQNMDWKTFMLFHANESGYFDIICKKVNDVVDSCPILQRIHEQFYCFILGSKRRNLFMKPLGVTTITDNFQESDIPSITNKPTLIKYYNPEFLQDVQDYFHHLDDEISLHDSSAIEKWHKILEENGSFLQRKGAI